MKRKTDDNYKSQSRSTNGRFGKKSEDKTLKSDNLRARAKEFLKKAEEKLCKLDSAKITVGEIISCLPKIITTSSGKVFNQIIEKPGIFARYRQDPVMSSYFSSESMVVSLLKSTDDSVILTSHIFEKKVSNQFHEYQTASASMTIGINVSFDDAISDAEKKMRESIKQEKIVAESGKEVLRKISDEKKEIERRNETVAWDVPALFFKPNGENSMRWTNCITHVNKGKISVKNIFGTNAEQIFIPEVKGFGKNVIVSRDFIPRVKSPFNGGRFHTFSVGSIHINPLIVGIHDGWGENHVLVFLNGKCGISGAKNSQMSFMEMFDKCIEVIMSCSTPSNDKSSDMQVVPLEFVRDSNDKSLAEIYSNDSLSFFPTMREFLEKDLDTFFIKSAGSMLTLKQTEEKTIEVNLDITGRRFYKCDERGFTIFIDTLKGYAYIYKSYGVNVRTFCAKFTPETRVFDVFNSLISEFVKKS